MGHSILRTLASEDGSLAPRLKRERASATKSKIPGTCWEVTISIPNPSKSIAISAANALMVIDGLASSSVTPMAAVLSD